MVQKGSQRERDYVLVYINGKRHEVRGRAAFEPLADYLRYHSRLTGTKIVCAEGDCGACTVLRARPDPTSFSGRPEFRGINSCIYPVFLADGSHIVTVEGLAGNDGEASEIQSAMVRRFGSQCGFCTPGFVMALADMFERVDVADSQDIKNHLTGNLCRCTGYQPIIDAALDVDVKKLQRVGDRYGNAALMDDLLASQSVPVRLEDGDRRYYAPVDLAAALHIRKKEARLKVYSGATDLGVRHNKGAVLPDVALSLHLVSDLHRLTLRGNRIRVGAKVNLRRLEQFVEGRVQALADFLHIFASPQIKESATLVGNLVNGSPIADTLPFLMVTSAEVCCHSLRGERKVAIESFFKGYKQLDVRADELVTAVEFQVPKKETRLGLYKVSQRRDLDISCVNAAFAAEGCPEKVERIRMAYGGVGPVPLRLSKTEASLAGLALTEETLSRVASQLQSEISPISDVRGSAAFRRRLAVNLLRKFSHEWNHDRAASKAAP